MIERIVDRCHVFDSNRSVIRYVISRLKHGHKTWCGIDRELRRSYLKLIIRHHKQNLDVYVQVMGGRR